MIQPFTCLDGCGGRVLVRELFYKDDIEAIDIDVIDLLAFEIPFKGDLAANDLAIPVLRFPRRGALILMR